MKHKIVILKKRVEGTSLDRYVYQVNHVYAYNKYYTASFDLNSFMGRGVINFPVERVAQYVGDQEQIYNWERFLEVSACLHAHTQLGRPLLCLLTLINIRRSNH